LTLPDHSSFQFQSLQAADSGSYSGALDMWYGDLACHRLLGYPQLISNPMEVECQVVSQGIFMGNGDGDKDPRYGELVKGANQWQLLLQIDSDDNACMQWGNGGRLYYWIRSDDLARGKFDNVWVIFQSY
jgi:uncharacterized protein YwqG